MGWRDLMRRTRVVPNHTPGQFDVFFGLFLKIVAGAILALLGYIAKVDVANSKRIELIDERTAQMRADDKAQQDAISERKTWDEKNVLTRTEFQMWLQGHQTGPTWRKP